VRTMVSRFQIEIGEAVVLRTWAGPTIPLTLVTIAEETALNITVMRGQIANWVAGGKTFSDRFTEVPNGTSVFVVDVLVNEQKYIILIDERCYSVNDVFLYPLSED